MAAIRGNLGVIEFGAAVVATTSYTLDTTQDTAETSAMGSTARTYIKTMRGFSGSADFVLEGGADAPQFDTIAAMDFSTDSGETCAFELHPEGDGSGNIKYNGTAIITGASYTTSFDGVVTGSITFQGTGTLTSAIA
mgnify:CR=1 FL=1|tara:strand:- start:416 stop:826 length:411 start_codon:yes stop_codon:yes gene_type:complete